MALNDPQWGNRKNGGPPDLEEMLRNLNRKISGFLGGKGGGGEPSHGNAGSGIGLIVAIVVLVWMGSGFYIVDAKERGIVLRFGKYQETTQAGARWHFPYPIETVEIVNLSDVRTVEVGYRDNSRNKKLQESQMLTEDQNIIDIQLSVQYFVKDPTDYLFNNRMGNDRDRERDKEIVRQAAEAAIREVVGKNKMDFVLKEGRAQVAQDTTKVMQDILDRYKSGIQLSKVNLQQAQPPEQVQTAFDDVVKAGQDRDRQNNEGKAYEADIVPRAQGAAARLRQEAEGYKKEVIANAEGDASRFKQILAEYNKAPQVTRERMYIDMMQQILSHSTKVLVDQKNGNSLLYLPLDKLMQSTSPGATPLPEMQPAKPADQQPQQPSTENRPSDATLSRDRRSRP